jgi:uncharacterized protein involved in response to NO
LIRVNGTVRYCHTVNAWLSVVLLKRMNQSTDRIRILLEIGFRPFFLGAGIFAVLSIGLWSVIYLFQLKISTAPISVLQWHAHEMIYGYALAVVAGFLLTAVANWTGLPTCVGKPLLLMFACWCLARVLYLFGSQFLLFAGLFDLVFIMLLLISIIRPIAKKRMWVRMAVVSKLVLLFVFNCVFLLGASGFIEDGARIGVYGGLYLIIGLILTVGKNLVPFFIARGVAYEVSIASFRWLDFTSLGLFLVFFVLELSSFLPKLSGVVAFGLFLVNCIRLSQWHTKGIWSTPLLWSLYLSYCFICLGFLLMGLHYFIGVSKYLAIHSFAVGGVGLITLSMMSRVALGHTGRNISKPPQLVIVAFLLLIACACVRVVLPLLISSLVWMPLSFIFWICAFLAYLWVYLPILLSPRIDL